MTIIKPVSALPKLRRRDVIAAAGAAATLPLTRRRARAADPIVFGWVGPLTPRRLRRGHQHEICRADGGR